MEALDASICEQDVDAPEFLFASDGGLLAVQAGSRWSSLMPSQRRPAGPDSPPGSTASTIAGPSMAKASATAAFNSPG